MDNTEEFRLLSLCSGYAGLELGLRRAVPNLRTVAYVEVEAFAAANLVSKMEAGLLDVAPVWTDIKTFNGWPFRRNVHIITAGYPCQPFSVAGKRKGTDDPRHLWPRIERIIEAVRPVWCFFENVPGHLTIGYPSVYRSLRNMGYTVEAGLFTAAEVGAPHRRKRLFILAKSCRTGTGGISGAINRQYRPQDVRQENGQACTARTQPTGKLAARLQENKDGSDSNGRQDAARDIAGILETNGGNRKKLADATGRQTQRPGPERAIQTERRTDQQGDKWPARPGQPQYEWEEPRTVGDAHCNACSTGRAGRTEKGAERGHQGKAESGLGLSVDGASCGMGKSRSKIDELRLLGNGVVPQQAEKAFRTLLRNFEYG